MKKIINWCNAFWVLFFTVSGGIYFNTKSAQLNTRIDNFDTIQIKTGSSTGTPSVRTTIGIDNGFTAEDLSVWKYDADAPIGSKFTKVVDFESEFVTPSDPGDRLYFGAPQGVKTWAICARVNVIKSSEKYIAKYYSLIADDFVPVGWVSMNDQCINQNGKDLWLISNQQYFTIDKNIDANWGAKDNILDKVPNTGSFRNWLVLEVPPSGIATPARISDVAYRSNGVSRLDCNSQDVFWGVSRLMVTEKIPAINFWDGGIPNSAIIDITSTQTQTVHKLRSALGDEIHGPWSLPFGIDTSIPVEISLTYKASTAINTADIQIDLKMVSKTAGLVGLSEVSDRIITKNLNITSAGQIDTIVLIDDYDISNFKENDIMFIQIKRTDSNGGEFYPIELSINHSVYKLGKF